MLQRIQFTVKYYKALQGLAVAALGGGLLLDLVWRAWLRWIIFPLGLDSWGSLLEVLVAGVLLSFCSWLGLMYYRRTFGQTNIPQMKAPAVVSGWVILCVVLVMIGMWIDGNLHLHISFIALAAAATLLVRWHCLDRTLHYYLGLATLMIGVSFLPFLPAVYHLFVQSKSDQFNYLLNATVGCLLIAVGLCDHVSLVLNMRRIRRLMLVNSEWKTGE